MLTKLQLNIHREKRIQYTENTNPSGFHLILVAARFKPITFERHNHSCTKTFKVCENKIVRQNLDDLKSYNFISNSQAVHETVLPEYSELITIKIGWKIHKLQSFWTLLTK
jgi:hypothetical protein